MSRDDDLRELKDAVQELVDAVESTALCCSVSECSNPIKARGWCGRHYSERRRLGDSGIRQKQEHCSECDLPTFSRGWCNTHYMRWYRTGSPLTVRPNAVAGPANANWKGTDLGYSGAHRRIYRYRGPAARFQCSGCAAPAEEWAYTHDDPDELVERTKGGIFAYSADPARYIPLCRACHRSRDINHVWKPTVPPETTRLEWKPNVPPTPDDTEVIRQAADNLNRRLEH